MYYFCPKCNSSFYKKDYDICPECGYNIKKYKQTNYIAKLKNSLNHKSGEIQHFALEILGRKKVKSAVPHIKKLIKTTKDPLLKLNAKETLKKITS